MTRDVRRLGTASRRALPRPTAPVPPSWTVGPRSKVPCPSDPRGRGGAGGRRPRRGAGVAFARSGPSSDTPVVEIPDGTRPTRGVTMGVTRVSDAHDYVERLFTHNASLYVHADERRGRGRINVRTFC